MSDGRSGEALARELAEALQAITTPPPGGVAASPGAPAGASDFSFAGPRSILENGARFVAPYLPPDAPMRAVKALVLRALRIVTRDQTVFNSALAEALRVALIEMERALAGLAGAGRQGLTEVRGELARRADEGEGRLLDALRRTREALDGRIEGARQEVEGVRRDVAAGGRAAEEWRRALQESLVAEQYRLADTLTQVAGDLARVKDELNRRMDAEQGARERLEHDRDDRAEEQARRYRELDGVAESLTLVAADLARVKDDLNRRLDDEERAREARAREEDARAEAQARRGEREDERLALLTRELGELSEEVREARLEWTSLRGRLRQTQATQPMSALTAALPPAAAVDAGDALRAGLYVDFERRFRGSEEEIRRRQLADVDLFRGAPGPVADLGCGRGELVQLLSENGVEAIGCDANPLMVAAARQKGLAVDEADLFGWLAARPDGSLGGLTAYQVVEHLPPARLFDLVELAVTKLAPGGRVLFETINPESVFAMKWFWMDLSHVRPVPAPSLAQLLTASGFRDVHVDFRSPVPEDQALPPGADPSLAPVARLLFAPQDYAVTALK